MISAFAKAGTVLMENTYVERAAKAAEFVRQHLYDPESGRLLRSCYRGAEQQVSQKYQQFPNLIIRVPLYFAIVYDRQRQADLRVPR